MRTTHSLAILGAVALSGALLWVAAFGGDDGEGAVAPDSSPPPRGAAAAAAPEIARRDLPAEDDATSASAEAPTNVAIDPELIDAAAKQFALLWEDHRRAYFEDAESRQAGDKMVVLSSPNWEKFHPALRPDESWFEGLSQADKNSLAMVLQTAASSADAARDEVLAEVPVEEQLERRKDLRDRSLWHSPETLLQDALGESWAENDDLVQATRDLWADMLVQVAPLDTEKDLYWSNTHRAFQAAGVNPHQVPGNWSEVVPLIAPSYNEVIVAREALCWEFHDQLMDLIREYRD